MACDICITILYYVKYTVTVPSACVIASTHDLNEVHIICKIRSSGEGVGRKTKPQLIHDV